MTQQNEKKLSSMLKKYADEETHTNITENFRKRRISFSGRKLVREFCVEEETKAWKDSYEVSDRSNNSETPQFGMTASSIRMSDVANKENQPSDTAAMDLSKFLKSNMGGSASNKTFDYINTYGSCSLHYDHILDITLTEMEKKAREAKQVKKQEKIQSSPTDIASSNAQPICSTHDSCDSNNVNKNNTKEIESKNHMDGMKDFDISFDMSLTLNNCIDNDETNKCNTNRAIATANIAEISVEMDSSPMDISSNMNTIRQQLQKTMFYNNNIDVAMPNDPQHVSTLQQTAIDKRKTIVFDANDARSDVDITVNRVDLEANHQDGEHNATEKANKNQQVINRTASPTKGGGGGIVVRKFVVKTTPGKTLIGSNSKKYALAKQQNDGEQSSKSQLNKTPLSKTQTFNSKIPIATVNTQSVPNRNDNEELVKAAAEEISKATTYKKKLTRYSQADEQLLDNTSYLTKAKLGDETASRNTSKCTPASSNRALTFDEDFNSTDGDGNFSPTMSSKSKPYSCKSLDFKEPISTTNKSKAKDLNHLDTTQDFAQPLGQTMIFDRNASMDISMSTFDFTSTSALNAMQLPIKSTATSHQSKQQVDAGYSEKRHAMLNDDMLMESTEPKEKPIPTVVSSSSSSSSTMSSKARRQTLIMCEDIEISEENNFNENMMLHNTNNMDLLPPPQNAKLTGILQKRRNTVIMNDDIQPDESVNDRPFCDAPQASQQRNNEEAFEKRRISHTLEHSQIRRVEDEIAAQIQSSIMCQQMTSAFIADANDSNIQLDSMKMPSGIRHRRETVYDGVAMQLDANTNEDTTGAMQRQAMPNGMRDARRTIHFSDDNITDIEHSNEMPLLNAAAKAVPPALSERTPLKLLSRGVTTPARKFNYTPQRATPGRLCDFTPQNSIIEYLNTERRIRMEMEMEADMAQRMQSQATIQISPTTENTEKGSKSHSNVHRRQTIYDQVDMDESHSNQQCPLPSVCDVLKKRLACNNLTPNVSESKKRQTQVFVDCAVNETQILENSTKSPARTTALAISDNTPTLSPCREMLNDSGMTNELSIQLIRKAATTSQRQSSDNALTVCPGETGNLTADEQHEQKSLFDVSKYKQPLNIMEFEGIDKTTISLASTTISLVNTQSDIDIETYCESVKLDECNTDVVGEVSALACLDKTHSNAVLYNAVLNDIAVLKRLKKRPKLKDVQEYYQRMSLEREPRVHHDDNTIVLGEWPNKPEDNADAIIRNCQNRLKQSARNAEEKRALALRPSFVERLDTLLKSHKNNWIFNYQCQAQTLLRFFHRKISNTIAVVTYKETSPMGQDIRVQRVHLKNNFVFPEKCWQPIDHIMNFQLKLELSGVDLTPSGDDEHAFHNMLLKLDDTFTQVERQSMLLWMLVVKSDALLVRDANQTYISKVVYTNTSGAASRSSGSACTKWNEQEFRINILNVKKMSYKDIFLPPLHMFNEQIQLMPTGLDFVREFLRAPTAYLRS